MRALIRAVDRHWFARASLRDLGVARIAIVAFQLLILLDVPVLGLASWADLESQLWVARTEPENFQPIPALKVLMLPFGEWGVRPQPMFLHAVWLLGVVAGMGALFGIYTRLSLLCFAASNTLLTAHGYSYREMHHPEALLIIVLWLLALAPSGGAWSLDDLRERIRSARVMMRFRPRGPDDDVSPYARWPLRTTQWLLVLAYLSAGLSKLGSGGLDWFNGYTLTYYFLKDGLVNDSALALWLAAQPSLATLLSVGSELFELTFVLAVLVPTVAWAYVLAGTAFHIVIFLVQEAPFFQYIALYSAFVEPLRRSANALRAKARPVASAPMHETNKDLTVLYDGACPLCIRSMVVIDYLDIRRRLRYVDFEHNWEQAAELTPALTYEGARHAMHVVTADGRLHRGFFAIRVLAKALPLAWPLVPFMYAPFSAVIGPRLYDLVARHRARVSCRLGTCGVHAMPAAEPVHEPAGARRD